MPDIDEIKKQGGELAYPRGWKLTKKIECGLVVKKLW
jgi:hypothetical protein